MLQGIIGHTNAASVSSILQGKLTPAHPSLPAATQIPIGMSSKSFQAFSARTVTQIDESGSTCLEGATTMIPESQYVPTEVPDSDCEETPVEIEVEVADDEHDAEQGEEAEEETHEQWGEQWEEWPEEWEESHEESEEYVEETQVPQRKKRRV